MKTRPERRGQYRLVSVPHICSNFKWLIYYPEFLVTNVGLVKMWANYVYNATVKNLKKSKKERHLPQFNYLVLKINHMQLAIAAIVLPVVF